MTNSRGVSEKTERLSLFTVEIAVMRLIKLGEYGMRM